MQPGRQAQEALSIRTQGRPVQILSLAHSHTQELRWFTGMRNLQGHPCCQPVSAYVESYSLRRCVLDVMFFQSRFGEFHKKDPYAAACAINQAPLAPHPTLSTLQLRTVELFLQAAITFITPLPAQLSRTRGSSSHHAPTSAAAGHVRPLGRPPTPASTDSYGRCARKPSPSPVATRSRISDRRWLHKFSQTSSSFNSTQKARLEGVQHSV